MNRLNRKPAVGSLRLLSGMLIVACFCISLQGGETFPFEISEWDMVRLRKGIGGSQSVLKISFTLKNVSGRDLERVEPSFEMREAMGQRIGAIEGGRIRVLESDGSERVTLSRDLVPAFNTYFVHVEYREDREKKEALFLGPSPYDKPIPVPSRPVSRQIRLMVMGYDFLCDPKTRSGLLKVRLRNFGGIRARRPVVRFRVYDGNRNILGRIEAPVRHEDTPPEEVESVGPGEEKIYAIPLRNVPSFNSYDLFVRHDPPKPEEVLGGDKFEGGEQVEIIVDKVKVEGMELFIQARARNGLKETVRDLEVDFHLTKKINKKDELGRETPETEVREVCGTRVRTGLLLEPEAEKEFQFVLGNAPASFDDYTYELAYSTGEEESTTGPSVSRKPAEPVPQVFFNVKGGIRRQDGRLELRAELKSLGEGRVSGEAMFHFLDAGGEEVTVRRYPFEIEGGETREFSLFFDNVGEFEKYNIDMVLDVPEQPDVGRTPAEGGPGTKPADPIPQ